MHIDVSSSFNCFRKKSLPQHEKGQYVFVQYDVYTAWTRVHIPRGHVSSRVTVQKPWST